MVATIQGKISDITPYRLHTLKILSLILLCLVGFTYPNIAHAQLPTCEYAISDFTDAITGISYETGDVYPSGFFIQDDTAIGTTNMAYCPSGKDFLISGTVCRVQAVVFRSMFHVYCSIFLQLTPLIGIVLTLYIMFYGIAILFGIKNASPKTAGFMAIKMIIVTLFIINADWMYFYLFRFLLEFMSEFSDLMLSTAPMVDQAGNVAIAYEYIGGWPPQEVYIAQNGEACTGNITPDAAGIDELPFVVEMCDPDVTSPDCTINVNSNGCTECVGSDCVPDPNNSSTCTTASAASVVMREPAPPLDVRGNPVWCVEDGTGLIQYFDVTGQPAGSTPGIPIREPYNGGIFSRIDILFDQLVTSDEETASLIFLAYAVSFMAGGMGFFLTILTLLGLVAMFIGFLRIMISYLTAVVALCFLLMLTPIFFAFALFKETNSLFRRWLQNMFSYTLQPVLIMAFLYTLAEAGSIQNFITQMSKGHQLMDNKQYVIGWEGFWQYTVEGPGFEQFTCYYEENGIEILGKNCTAYSRLTGEPNATCINYDITADDSPPYSQYPVVSGNPVYTECAVRCWDNEGRRRDDCINLKCVKRGPDGSPLIPEEPTTGCVNPDQVKPLTRQAAGLILAWLFLSALIGGFVEMLPRLAQRLTRVLGAPTSTVLTGKSGSIGGLDGRSAYMLDRGVSGLYTLEGMARPLVRRGQNMLGGKGGRQGPLQKLIMGGTSAKRGQPNVAQKGSGKQPSLMEEILFGKGKTSRQGGQQSRGPIMDFIYGLTRRK